MVARRQQRLKSRNYPQVKCALHCLAILGFNFSYTGNEISWLVPGILPMSHIPTTAMVYRRQGVGLKSSETATLFSDQDS